MGVLGNGPSTSLRSARSLPRTAIRGRTGVGELLLFPLPRAGEGARMADEGSCGFGIAREPRLVIGRAAGVGVAWRIR